MRVGELSKRSGVPIPTIKYYLREGLLSPGVATAANQADYTEEHLRRLRLIRALIDVGGVSVAAAREVTDALNRDADNPLPLLGDAQMALARRHRPDRGTPEWAEARARVDQLIKEHGWRIEPHSPAADLVADTLAALAALNVQEVLANVGHYAELAQALAHREVRDTLARPAPADRMELVILGTVLGEALFAGLRMLAHQHESATQING